MILDFDLDRRLISNDHLQILREMTKRYKSTEHEKRRRWMMIQKYAKMVNINLYTFRAAHFGALI